MKCIHNCLICRDVMPPFVTTPLLKDDNGELNSCCERCADEQFPGWREDEEEDDEKEEE